MLLSSLVCCNYNTTIALIECGGTIYNCNCASYAQSDFLMMALNTTRHKLPHNMKMGEAGRLVSSTSVLFGSIFLLTVMCMYTIVYVHTLTTHADPMTLGYHEDNKTYVSTNDRAADFEASEIESTSDWFQFPNKSTAPAILVVGGTGTVVCCE
jgi:hypothetical protein